jgi:hypothetical protein
MRAVVDYRFEIPVVCLSDIRNGQPCTSERLKMRASWRPYPTVSDQQSSSYMVLGHVLGYASDARSARGLADAVPEICKANIGDFCGEQMHSWVHASLAIEHGAIERRLDLVHAARDIDVDVHALPGSDSPVPGYSSRVQQRFVPERPEDHRPPCQSRNGRDCIDLIGSEMARCTIGGDIGNLANEAPQNCSV